MSKDLEKFSLEVSEAFALCDIQPEDVIEMNYLEYESVFDDLTIGQIKGDLFEFYRFFTRVRKAAEKYCVEYKKHDDINDDW